MPLAAATLHVDECSLTHYTFGLGPGGWLWRWGGPRTWAPSPQLDQWRRLAPGALEDEGLERLASAWGQLTLLQVLR